MRKTTLDIEEQEFKISSPSDKICRKQKIEVVKSKKIINFFQRRTRKRTETETRTHIILILLEEK
jgi:hypothetical protein